MSDIHGEYEKYIKMLDKINFKDEDMLYILGDIVDRGPHPIKVILDLMKRPNVVCLAGNHEQMAMECFGFLMQEISEASINDFSEEMVEKLINWQENGAIPTTDEFHQLDKKTKQEVIDFIGDFDVYEEVIAGDKEFVLVHAGFRNYSPDRELWDYELDELVWERMDYDVQYFEDKYVVTGHTPTQLIDENPRKGYIYHNANNIAIDCGAHFEGGRLGCICLETFEEFYVE